MRAELIKPGIITSVEKCEGLRCEVLFFDGEWGVVKNIGGSSYCMFHHHPEDIGLWTMHNSDALHDGCAKCSGKKIDKTSKALKFYGLITL